MAVVQYYIEYPGITARDPRLIPDRLHNDLESAIAEARETYVRETDLAKVIVARYPDLRHVATVAGPRSNPKVYRRRPVR